MTGERLDTMSRAVVCIGSNVAEAQDKTEAALSALLARGCVCVSRSGAYRMESSAYINEVAVLDTPHPYETLRSITKEIERSLGRTPQMKATGTVPVDIDVVVYDGVVMRQRDYDAPYFMMGYRRLA